MNEFRSTRIAALVAMVATALAVVYAAVAALTGRESSLGWLIQSAIHLGELAAVVALAFSGLAGSGHTARIGLGVAMAGQAVLAVAELVWPSANDLGDTLFGVGPVLTGIGLVTAGVAVLRHGQWRSLRRFTPIAVGVYVFVVMMPVLIGTGGPPAPAALWAIGGWDLLWSFMAASVLVQRRSATSQPPLERRSATGGGLLRGK